MPIAIGVYCIHKGIGDEDGEVEICQPASFAFGVDEVFNVWVVAAHGGHHGPSARSCGHNCAAHGVPYVHETEWAGGICANTHHCRAFRANGGEVIADAATLLHGEGGFFETVENGAHIVADGAHHKAVEKRYVSFCACTCDDAACG